MFKKLLAALATAGLALGMIAVTAAPASAHHNTINPVITCTDTYQYKVDWSVTNSETLTETITESSDKKLVPVGTTLGNKETKVFTEYFSAPVDKTLQLKAKWSNNNTAENEAKIKKRDFPTCAPNHVPVTLCHATPPDTAAQGWESITVDDDAIVKSAHNEQHDYDIIPAFDYWEKVDGVWTQRHFAGKNLDTVFSGIPGSAILAAGCDYTVSPTAPTFTAAVCTGPGTHGDGGYTIPSVVGVHYEIRLGGTGGWTTKAAGTYPLSVGTSIQVRAIADPGWVGLTGTTEWSYTVADPGACLVTVTPVEPTVTTITECGTYGSVELPTTTGVSYALTAGDGLKGHWEVTATALDGYTFAGGQTTQTFSGDLGEYTECVTPGEPTFVDSVCTAPGQESGGTYWIPDTTGVRYEVKVGDGVWTHLTDGSYTVTEFPTTVSIRAIAEDGYTIVDSTGPWTHTFESAGDCTVKTSPVAPTATPITECGVYGDLDIPTTTGVSYELTAGDGLQGYWEVTATPMPGYYFASGLTEEIFSGDLGEYTECVTPVEPTVTPITECGAYGSIVFPDTEGVDYQLTAGDGRQGLWQVTATPLPGFAFADGSTEKVFSGDLGTYRDCVTATEPTFTDAVCTGPGESDDGSYVVPSTPGVTYEVKVGDGEWLPATADTYPVTVFPTTVSIRAIADEGYELVGDAGPWTHIFESAGECLELATPVEPAVTPITECGVYGSVVPAETEGVVYTLTEGDGLQGAWTVTATPAEGYYFAEGQTEIVFSGDLGQHTTCAPTQAIVFVDGECVPLEDELDPATASDPVPAIVGTLVPATFTIPAVTGIQFTVSINGGDVAEYEPGTYKAADLDAVVVTAHALPGYTVVGQSEWSHTFPEVGPCDPPTLGEVFPAASATSQTCTAQGTLELKPTEHVIYSIDGEVSAQGSIPVAPGTYTVSAVTDSPEWGIFGPDEWVLTVDASGPCPQVLASTGTVLPIVAGSVAGGLVFLGIAFLLVRRRRAA